MTRLVIVTLVLAALALVLRKRSGSVTRLHAIKVTARATMHRGASIAVVEVDGRRLLVGAGAQSINLIADLGAVDPDTSPTVTTSHITETTARDELLPAVPATPVAAALTAPMVVIEETPVSFVDKVRRATTRTADPALRSTSVRNARRPSGVR
jgi:flagellar biogenesis protein FliO